jgi:hypothetical protein
VSSTVAGVPNSYYSYANNPALTGAALPGTGLQGASRYGAAALPANHTVQVTLSPLPRTHYYLTYSNVV